MKQLHQKALLMMLTVILYGCVEPFDPATDDQHLPGPLISEVTDPRLPDVRNTLCWEPSLVIEPGGEREILFTTPDVKGRYEIVIRGMDSSGKSIYTSVPFSVE